MWPVVTSLFIRMAPLFEILTGHPKRHFGAGETIIAQESTTGMLFFLIDGEVEVYKDDVQLATTSEPGSVFGEMSALLGTSHRASVRIQSFCPRRRCVTYALSRPTEASSRASIDSAPHCAVGPSATATLAVWSEALPVAAGSLVGTEAER